MQPKKGIMNIRLHNLSGGMEPNFCGRGTAGASADALILLSYYEFVRRYLLPLGPVPSTGAFLEILKELDQCSLAKV